MAAPRLPLPRRARSAVDPAAPITSLTLEARAALRPDPSAQREDLRKRLRGKQASYLPNTHAQVLEKGLDAPAAADRTSADVFAPLPEDLRASLVARSFATARREAYAFVVEPSLEDARTLSLDALAVAEAMARHVGSSTLALVASARSLADAVRVASLADRLGTASIGGYPNDVHFTPDGRYAHFHEASATELRHLVCAADEASYADALATARTLRDALGDPAPFDPNDHATANAERRRTHARQLFAFAFPDAPFAEEELAALLAAGHPPHVQLLASLTTLASAQAIVQARGAPYCASYVHEIADALPEDDAITLLEAMLPELLKKPRYQALPKTPPRELVQALARLPSPRVSAILARYAKDPVVGVTVLEIFRTQPERASALQEHGKLAGLAARVVGTRAEDDAPLADDYPELLRTRPWRAKAKKPKPIVVPSLPILGEERAFVDRTLLPTPTPSTAPMLEGPARDAWWAHTHARHRYAFTAPEVEHEGQRYALADADFLECFTLAQGVTVGSTLVAVARLGLDALPALAGDWSGHLHYETAVDRLTAAMALVSPRMGASLANVTEMKKAWRDRVLGWFRRHAEIVVPGLLPAALGEARGPRAACESVLLHLRDRGHTETIRTAARALGEDAAAGIEALLAYDVVRAPAKVPARPSFLRVEALPELRTTKGARLPDEARDAWLDLLSLGRCAEPHPGALVVANERRRSAGSAADEHPRSAGSAADEPHLDRASLEAFALELFEQWVLGDAPGRHEWMAYALALSPSDAGTARLAAFAREQARKNAAKAERACQVLAAIGSDPALAVLELVATTSRYTALTTTASALREQAARERGLSVQELADRTLPDAGLDAHGRSELRRGQARLQLWLDPASLTLRVREHDDAEWKNALPRAKKAIAPKKTSKTRAKARKRGAIDDTEPTIEAAATTEVDSSETNASETNASETNASETNASETNASETNASETRRTSPTSRSCAKTSRAPSATWSSRSTSRGDGWSSRSATSGAGRATTSRASSSGIPSPVRSRAGWSGRRSRARRFGSRRTAASPRSTTRRSFRPTTSRYGSRTLRAVWTRAARTGAVCTEGGRSGSRTTSSRSLSSSSAARCRAHPPTSPRSPPDSKRAHAASSECSKRAAGSA
ncbi:MAG: hypothetical protein MUE69_03845 [Myxococcota bacterium]|nr:hypothetical protein [Myxococcota bacterium]